MIRYELAPEIESKLKRITRKLKMNHIDLDRVKGCEVTVPQVKES